MWAKNIELAIGIITIILIMYISKNVLNIETTIKPKAQINSYAENVHIVRLSDNATQIINANFVQYIGSTIFAKKASLINNGKNPFTLESNEVYVYENNNVSLIGDCIAKGKNFLVKTQKAYWFDANNTLSSDTNAQFFSPKIDIQKSNGFSYNKKTNTLVVYKADVWIK